MCVANRVCITESTTRGEVVRTLSHGRRLPVSVGSSAVCCVKPSPTESKHPVNSTKPAATAEVSGCTPELLSLNRGTVVNGKGESGRMVSTIVLGGTICFTTINKTNTLLSGYVGSSRMVYCSSLNTRTVEGVCMRSFPMVIMVSDRKGGLCRASVGRFGGVWGCC